METIQVVLDKELLRAADQAVRKLKRNRSALMRDALREYLRRLEIRTKEDRDREGYGRQHEIGADQRAWEAEAAWPEK